jgi:two-component sensor histidine kinase
MSAASWPEVFRDDVLLVANELVSNAVHATADGSDIDVGIELHSDSLCLTVSNCGIGFELHSLAPPTRTQARGRGVAISQRLGHFSVEQVADLTTVRVEMKQPVIVG